MKRSTLLSTVLVSSSILGFADPLPEPAPKISSATTGFNLDWDGTNGNTYFIEYSSDLVTWQYMPIIESGTGNPLGYGFSAPDDRLFLRLKYTDVATSNALTDDFDGDGISNWDEIRIGGSNTDPFLWDTDGDGKSDYFSDRDGNGMSDGWELKHYAGIGVANPSANDDSDSLSNLEESLMGSEPLTADTDKDGKNDDIESIWWDGRVEWPRSPESSYVVVELDGLTLNQGHADDPCTYSLSYDNGDYSSDHLEGIQIEQDSPFDPHWVVQSLSNAGHVLVVEDHRGYTKDWAATGRAIDPSTIPNSIRNHVWDPGTGNWVTLKNDSVTGITSETLAVATDISNYGIISGFSWLPSGMEDGDEIIPNDGHGIEKIAVKWSEINAGTSPSAITQAVEPGYPTFSSDHTTFELPFEMYGISDQDHMLYSHTEGAEWEISLKLGTTKIPNYDYDYGFYEWRGAFLTNQDDVFYRTETGDIELRLANGVVETVADGAEPPTKIHHATRVTHTPEAMDMIALSPSLWIRDSSSWKKIKKHPQAKEFITGIGVSENGVILENETTILRNGKKMSIQNLVNSTEWSGFKMAKMNDNGMMAGVATKEGEEKVVLLLPVDLDVDNNGNYNDIVDGVAKYLPGYVGNDSKLDDGASFDEASYAGAQAMRIRIPGLKADKATFEITDVSKHKGYSGNGIDDSLVAGNDEDFSFAADTNFIDEEGERKIEATVDSTGIWAPIYCKDYGAWCEIEITLKKEDGTTLGEPLKITLPADVNGDKLADHWQKEQVKDWNKQYNLIIGDEKWADPERPGTWAVVFGDTHSADRDAQDMELADSDGPRGNPVAIMKADGDGLKSIDEYRGYFLDGGPNITTPRHSRLSVARKELLVECSEAVDIKDAVNNGTGTNPAISAYDFTSMMVNVSNFYRDPDKGAEIDLYWCRDDFKKITDKYTYEVDLERTYDAFFENGQGHYIGSPADPDTVTTGGNTIYFDQRWRDESPEDHDEVYSSDALSLLKKSRDDDQLQHFVKLFLGHRRAIVSHGETGRHLRLNSQLAFSGDTADYDRNGSLVFVSGIADESYFGVWESEVGSMVSVPLYSEVRFTEILDYLVAHELGHLLMNAANTQGFNGSEHTAESYGGLMAEDGYTKSLNILKFKAIEINNIDLRNRASIKP